MNYRLKEEVIKTAQGELRVHPAYATITASRPMPVSPQTLFGHVEQRKHSVVLTIRAASVLVPKVGESKVKSENTLLELELSYDQWAELVASVGNNTQVPATLTLAPPPTSHPVVVPGIDRENV